MPLLARVDLLVVGADVHLLFYVVKRTHVTRPFISFSPDAAAVKSVVGHEALPVAEELQAVAQRFCLCGDGQMTEATNHISDGPLA